MRLAPDLPRLRRFAALLLPIALLVPASAWGAPAECVVPARPGGGFELTCRLVQAVLEAGAKERVRLSYMPGGIGAVAFETFATQRAAEPDTLVAFSGGSLLNLAQRKFSRYSERDVRWVAILALDYGVVAVRANARFASLRAVVEALRADPRKVTFGIGGTVGGQDWTKAALLARAAGVDPRSLRYVSFEGGGDALVALEAGHVDVVPGDLAEAAERQARGAVRLLAVLSDQRIPGRHVGVPTAREQGFAVTWPTLRGVYMGPKVRDADYARWVATFERLLATDALVRNREELGLLPYATTGQAAAALVQNTIRDYAVLARELGLDAP